MTGGGATPDALLEWMRGHTDDMTALLEKMVRSESPSGDPASHQEVLDLLDRALSDVGLTTERVAGTGVGDHLCARAEPPRDGRSTQLLLGHFDTVWPLGTLDTMPLEREGDRLAGPGTFDMKSGLVQMVFALRAVRDLSIPLSVPPVVFVNSDEEIGSPDSTRIIRRLAATADRAFVLEGSFGPDGDLKTARKGVGRFHLKVKGIAAHAGLDPGAGASAVLEISQQIQRIFELNDLERGITLNVGMVDGGLRPNVVAPEATAEIDCRVPTHEDARRVEAALRSLEPLQPGVTVEIEGGFGRLPMEPTERNQALWQTAKTVADQLGLSIADASVGGASDGNTTSQFTATLDGLGGVGDGAHAPHEHVQVSRMPERSALLTLLLAAPPSSGGGAPE